MIKNRYRDIELMWGGDRIPEIDDERTSQHDEFGSLTGFLTREADGEPSGVVIRGLIKPLERREPCKGSVTPVTLREVARLRVQNGWFWARNASFRSVKWPPEPDSRPWNPRPWNQRSECFIITYMLLIFDSASVSTCLTRSYFATYASGTLSSSNGSVPIRAR